MTGASQSGPAGPLTVGLDVGTSSLKAVVVDERGHVLERCRLASGLRAGNGIFEHDAANTWWQLPRHALAQVSGTLRPRVGAVAVAAPVPSLCAVGEGGEPIGPGLLYGDARGQFGSQGAPGAGAGADAHGDPTSTSEMLHMAKWAARTYPGALGYWPAQAVANASIGGEGVLDLASAFASGALYDGAGWSAAACQSIGITPSQLPRVSVFGEAVGEVRADVMPRPGPGPAVLAAGSVDGFCEQLVSGASEDGDLLVVLGSTLVVWLCVPGWPQAAPGLWKVPHLTAGKAMLGGASNAGGLWIGWLERLLGSQATGPDDDLVPGRIPLWWPWSRGERVPVHDRDLRIALAGADLSHGPDALRRAGFEASAFVVRRIAELAAQSGTPVKRVMAVGGGTGRPEWAQAIADALSLPVTTMLVPESAALGAAFLARMAMGGATSLDEAASWASWGSPLQPDARWSGPVDERYQRWLAAC